MTREEKQKAIDALKISVPIKALTQEEFNDYIQTLNKIMDWIEQEPKTGHWIRVDKTKVKCSKCEITHLIAQYPSGRIDYCPNCGARMSEVNE